MIFPATLISVAPLASNAGARPGPVTFARDVAPIFQARCQVCHRPGSMAPMSLLTYEDARPWARAIRERVARRLMPPWHIDPAVGIQKYKNDRSLTDAQIETILRWVDNGAPLADPTDLPARVPWPDEETWTFGRPDLVVTSPAHRVGASAPDWLGDFVVETGLTEDATSRPSKRSRPEPVGRCSITP